MGEKVRCSWAGNSSIYVDYHDKDWGRPVHEDVKLFEMLVLEGMQAGLTWITVLKKHEAFREAFDGFDPKLVALYDAAKVQELMTNQKIIRNRLNISAAVNNAKRFLEIVEKYGSFDTFIWQYVDYKPVTGHWIKIEDLPPTTLISDKISKDMKKIGFKFVGSTIIYAFMQATGMVNDHITNCFTCKKLTSTTQLKTQNQTV
ncbi:MAG: DNA-3-methyladenine glycosylase I [Nitrososphaerota archaeon]|jgi:DNA-3-methyladenine glycosylase I|nr:DNA-3-methyladenine glycosylase I [Nitrososphaerota archaeon]